ncbi:DUF5634 family protein [Bacillus salitolerans]|uniref:DUF5634 family protein n=1 Tax=Bacillus salitolerans TaxID=1437434 RepID=A0ABW4LX86_9BACI
MNFTPREEIMNYFVHSLESVMDKYDLDDIGIYEEEGAGSHYYMGYTVRKGDKVYMINQPYVKNDQKHLAIEHEEWTIQSDDGKEVKGIATLDEVFHQINKGVLH